MCRPKVENIFYGNLMLYDKQKLFKRLEVAKRLKFNVVFQTSKIFSVHLYI